ncbi:MAG TPA: AAA family ATPase [Thermoanaerobaculia bacterium]|nr:AAA family ATPase [Thermoanaerobaculia bacterium]
MRFTHVRLENWRNFRHVDTPIRRRVFIVGPNASGKSNLLDVFRFLRDVAEPEGGFQRAVKARGGLSHLRCLHARRQPDVTIEVDVAIADDRWSYLLEFSQDPQRNPVVKREIVRKNEQPILSRPDDDDQNDRKRLEQTHLEQLNANRQFRELADFFAQVKYLHIVPQLVRDTDRVRPTPHDPYGSDFLEQIAVTPKRTLEYRLRRINAALQVAVPQLERLELGRDDRGVPHLKGLYKHWRPNAGWQTEEDFSDGTLRLIGLLWALLDGAAPLLLEEPELSLHAGVVRYIPAMMARAGRKTLRQIFVSTHSADLLADESIAPEEVLLLEPSEEGTRVRLASADSQVIALLEGGVPIAEVVLPVTAPAESAQLVLFGE